MSAWLVTEGHIDVIVQGAIQLDLTNAEDATETGRTLLLENYRSLAARYGDSIPEDIGYHFRGLPEGVEVDPAAVLQAVQCYAYQASEHIEWGESAANDLCVRLEAACREAGATDVTANDWPWGYVSIHQATEPPMLVRAGR